MKGVHHVGISVPDLDRALGFYLDVLGLELADPPSPIFDDPALGPAVGVPGANLRQVNLACGDSIVELLEYTAPSPPRSDAVRPDERGAAHLAFQVEDASSTKADLEAKGVEFLSDLNVVDEGVLAGWRWVYFRDPFGIVLELVEVAYLPPEEERRRGIAAYLESRNGG